MGRSWRENEAACVPSINGSWRLRSNVLVTWGSFPLLSVSVRDKETFSFITTTRMACFNAIRSFFTSSGYRETDVSQMTRHPDLDESVYPFETTVETPTETFRAGLITSPEYQMKKLLAAGMDRIFFLGHVFRNGETFDATHRPEFTMAEWYHSGEDYVFGVKQTEELVHAVSSALGVSSGPLLRPWETYRVADLFLQQLGIEEVGACPLSEMQAHARRQGIHIADGDSWSDLFYRLFLAKIEPDFPKDKTIVVKEYPRAQAALARLCSDGIYAERFEIYTGGLELCNAYTELTDATEQRKRFDASLVQRQKEGKPLWPIDEELLRLLPSVRQPTFGNALGVERLLMSLLGLKTIEQITL